MASAFSKRHYETIARVMQETCPGSDWTDTRYAQWNDTILALANAFKHDNSQFKSWRFERACLPGANVRARSR